MNNKADILDSEYTLQILEVLESNPKATQRNLAQKLEISLGKINFIVNALIGKGIIEARNFKTSRNKMAYMYLLTPEGIKRKIELIHKFFSWKVREYERLKQEIERLREKISVYSGEPLRE